MVDIHRRQVLACQRVRMRGWAAARRPMLRDQVVRRVAFMLELLDRVARPRRDHPVSAPSGPHVPEDCVLLAVVAHWRSPQQGDTGPGVDPLLRCLDGLLTLPVRRLEVVVTTNDDVATLALLEDRLAGGDDLELVRGAWDGPRAARITVRVERWTPRRLRRHGFHLTWHHQDVFRRALRAGDFTHLLYLEDDIRLTPANLAYWLAAREALWTRGALPGFVRFERLGDRRVLVDQTRSGQHAPAGPTLRLDGIGEVAVRTSLRPYQAGYLIDRGSAVEHLRSSPFRSPLRSNVARWDLRERAAAGPTFGPTPQLVRAILRPRDVRPPIRNAVLLAAAPDVGTGLVEGALIEHLRPTYSSDVASRHGKVVVEEF